MVSDDMSTYDVYKHDTSHKIKQFSLLLKSGICVRLGSVGIYNFQMMSAF